MTAELNSKGFIDNVSPYDYGYRKTLRNEELQLLTKMMNHELHNNDELIKLLDFEKLHGQLKFVIEATNHHIYQFVISTFESNESYATASTSGMDVLSDDFDIYEKLIKRFNDGDSDYFNFLGFEIVD